ncbi:regulatory protein NosR [Rhodosalinus halophilus]|uniref:Regulatory protein NosR n=1 Tax=Rhodosalinus halophilus TaxID=2259333 RepID=A0A365U5N7_9RHOB|nr:NosR/NirI family protein [Rhodosalinus halophilus]RBI83623.1 regulatory protein NosR [Rhodosalinus halophilus]
MIFTARPVRRTIRSAVLAAAFLCMAALSAVAQAPVLARFLDEVPPAELVAGADAYGPLHEDLPVAPVLDDGETVAWAFVTSDFVGTTGYSGKPIHVMAAVNDAAQVTGVKLVEHAEPIVLIGIPEARMARLTEDYAGLDLVAEAETGGEAHDLEIISGATVTIMVIDDSIVRAGLKVARALGLGGLAPRVDTGPQAEIDPDAAPPQDWAEAEGDGTIRRLTLDAGQVNAAFEALGDPRATERPVGDSPEETFIDMHAALVSVPAIGQALLGEREYANLQDWLEEGEHAILVAGRGLYSFKGSGYVRGGIFDRIVLVQDDASVRFRDRGHRRLGGIALSGAPSFEEVDLFKIPADAEFDPTEPWRLQLLVQREVAALERLFVTFDLGYDLPERFEQPVASPAEPSQVALAKAGAEESAAQAELWKRIWRDKTVEIAGVIAMLTVLTGAFFFQNLLTRSARAVDLFRLGFLTVTLVFLGWYANAQLSVVNLMALAGSLASGFSWQAFLLDPLTFILWFSVAAALIFWGRGAYCGWLCPFGALQELTNRIARRLRVPQWELPWGLHERLWPIKYMIFLGLFAVTLVSIETAEKLAEVEPFKTAIILNFMRAWPFVLYALVLLFIGLFVERFFCRYLCPLGAGLAIPARLRMFDWLKRYRECGNPCQTCANECPVQAIHPEGQINPNECINCMHCQVLYHSETKCPVVIRQLKRREKAAAGAADLDRAIQNHPNQKKGKVHV